VLNGFLGQVQRDFEAICAGDFSELATVSDGTQTIEIRCLFDEAAVSIDTEAQSVSVHPEPRITVAETATDFDLRRSDLRVTVRGREYKPLKGDRHYDGLGQLVIYLTPVGP